MTGNNKTMVTVFESKDFGKVRTADIDNKIYFCGSDVAKALGYARPADAITSHCKGSAFYRPLRLEVCRKQNSSQRVMFIVL